MLIPIILLVALNYVTDGAVMQIIRDFLPLI